MNKLFFLLSLMCLSQSSFSQTSLGGTITDAATGEELIGANIMLSQNGNFVTGTSTDFDGNYRLTIDPGVYTIKVYYVGFAPEIIESVSVEIEQIAQLDIAMKNPKIIICGFVCGEYKIPLLRVSETSSGLTIPDYSIRPMSTKKVRDIIATAPGVTFSR